MYAYKFFLSFAIIGVIVSCNEHDVVETIPVKFPGVDPELRVYFERFEEEARVRGLSVDLTGSGITGTIQEIDEKHVLGRCSFPRAQPNQVTIDRSFWTLGTDLFREFVVFHELGHCFLFRPHVEDKLSNGACVSIMRSGSGSCLDNYSHRTRMLYINELFDHQPSELTAR